MQDQLRQPKFPKDLDDEEFYSLRRYLKGIVNLPPTSDGNLFIAVCAEVRAVKGPDQWQH